ncbi:MAG: PH domain-containing protein [bacterium]
MVRYGPARASTAAAAVGAVVAAGLAIGADDRPGRLLFALASAAVALLALRGVVYFPALTVSATGLAVQSPGGSGAVPWPRVEAVRVDERPRLGLIARTLEIDLGDELLVFGRYTLGADPRDVAGVISALRPANSSHPEA